MLEMGWGGCPMWSLEGHWPAVPVTCGRRLRFKTGRCPHSHACWQTPHPHDECVKSAESLGGTKRATSVNMPLLRLQSSEGKFAMSREIEPVRRSFCRRGSGTFTEVARLVCYKKRRRHLSPRTGLC